MSEQNLELRRRINDLWNAGDMAAEITFYWDHGEALAAAGRMP